MKKFMVGAIECEPSSYIICSQAISTTVFEAKSKASNSFYAKQHMGRAITGYI